MRARPGRRYDHRGARRCHGPELAGRPSHDALLHELQDARGCSDGQALAIAIAANQGEIDEAKAVVNRLSNAEVRAFAQQMIADHTRLRDQLLAVAANPSASVFGGSSSTGSTGTPIVQQPNAISSRLQTESQKTVAELTMLEGSHLDQTYLEREILDHLTTLALMDNVVIPSVTNPVLAMALGSGTPIVKMHEMLALQVQTRIEGTCGGNVTQSAADAGAGTTDSGTSTSDSGTATTSDAGSGDSGMSSGATSGAQ
jgi:putative membrane protein